MRFISKVLPVDVFKLAVILKTVSPRVNYLLERRNSKSKNKSLSKRKFIIGDAVLEITASLNTSAGKTFEIDLKEQECSSNIINITNLIRQNLHAFHFTKFYTKSKNFIFILQPIKINVFIYLVHIRNVNICILGFTKRKLNSFLLLVKNELD